MAPLNSNVSNKRYAMTADNNRYSPNSWRKEISVWWSFFWRTIVYFTILTKMLSFMIAIYVVANSVNYKIAVYMGAAVFYLALIPTTMLALRQTIRKHFST